MKEKNYWSKILLFGEYTVIHGGSGLAIPYHGFGGRMDYTKLPHPSNKALSKFCDYLASSEFDFSDLLDIPYLKEKLSKGLIFNSNIPLGYGIGSSGAVVAAIFDQFRKQKIILELDKLKTVLASMESFFHGTSSGIDPLVSFLQQPLYLQEQGQIELLDHIETEILNNFYLLDTGITRNSAPLIRHYKKKFNENLFKSGLSELKELVAKSIQAMMHKNHHKSFSGQMMDISKKQWQLFQRMIPESIKPVWRKGLESGTYAVKLCGAGGGGFFLIYSEHMGKLSLSEFPLLSLYHQVK